MVTGGVIIDLALVHFSHQEPRLRLKFECIISNHPHTSAFESWVMTISASLPPFTASQPFQFFIMGMMNGWGRWRLAFLSISTLPTFHHKYDEWLERVEIGICAL
eukprot:scaffold4918_cov46-Cyclotella_meneghiniana.AAC.3